MRCGVLRCHLDTYTHKPSLTAANTQSPYHQPIEKKKENAKFSTRWNMHLAKMFVDMIFINGEKK